MVCDRAWNIFTVNDKEYMDLARVVVQGNVYVYLNGVADEDEFLIKELDEEKKELKEIASEKYMDILKALDNEITQEEIL